MLFNAFYNQNYDPFKAQIYSKSSNYRNIVNQLNNYIKGWGWRSHRERCQSLMKIVLYAFNHNKLQNLKCVFLHQQYSFDKNQTVIKNEDPYLLNAVSIYVGALGSGYINFNEFDYLLKEPNNINTSQFSQTSYYNLIKKILANSSPEVSYSEKRIIIPLLFQNASSGSFTILEINCFIGVLLSIQNADSKILAPILQFWSNLFSVRLEAYRNSENNKLYRPLDGGDIISIYSNLFKKSRPLFKTILSNARKEYCKNAVDNFLNEELYTKGISKNICDKEDYIDFVKRKTMNFWDF